MTLNPETGPDLSDEHASVLGYESPERLAAAMEGQDDAPAEPKEWTAAQIGQLARQESRTQSTLRGPILLTELSATDPPEIYYRRLSIHEADEVIERFKSHGTYSSVVIDRALDRHGKKLFSRTYLREMDRVWNGAMLKRICEEIAIGSTTQLTDDQLGN